MREYQMIIPKITQVSDCQCIFLGGGGKKPDKTEGNSKNPPTFCRLRSQNLGKKETLNLRGDKIRWWYRHPRQRIQVEHLCFFFGKKKLENWNNSANPSVVFASTIFLVVQNIMFQKTPKKKDKKLPPASKITRKFQFFFQIRKNLHPSPRCQSRSPDHTPGAINSRSHCRSERALEGYPSPGFFVVEVTTTTCYNPETLKLTGNRPPWK